MRLKMTIVTSCDSLIVILVTWFFSPLKLENGLRRHLRKLARIKYGFVESVVIHFTFNTRCDCVVLSDFAYTAASA